jgi:hypothetical protein
VPGAIPVLVDPLGEPTVRACGRTPIRAFVIGVDGKIMHAMAWASVREVEAALVRITGRAPSCSPRYGRFVASARDPL